MNINKIINEEISALSKQRQTLRNVFNFKTQVTGYFINTESLSKEYEADVTGGNIIVAWELELNYGSTAVDNISINIVSLEGHINVEYRDKFGQLISETPEQDINTIPWNKSVGNADLVLSEEIIPIDAEFDFQTKTCRINFS